MSAFGAGVAVEVDSDGYFASADGVAQGEAHPGAGVRMAFVDAARGRLVGRMTPRADAPSVWARAADGSLVPRALRASPTSSPRRAAVLAAALAALASSSDSETTRGFSERCGGPAAGVGVAPAGDVDLPKTGTYPPRRPAAGLPLAAWAPSEDLFVRFRSVEAAYRFARAADELAAALLVAEDDDARDYGTLRLVLHDLLLPTIWRTNPESERGASEVGLVIAPPFVRGRLSAAAILRIVDPELHRMQTQAGVAEEATEGHLWRPADDPFPAERARFNFRTIPSDAPDVEIVATDRALLDRVASMKSSNLDRSDEYAAARAPTAPGGVAATDEAAFAYCLYAVEKDWKYFFPGILQSATRSLREGAGLTFLADQWIGHAADALRPDAHVGGPSILASVEAVRVTTDARGAAVWIKCVDAAAARAVADSLRGLASAGAAADRACRRNLADLVPLALVEAPADDVAERNFVVLGWKPVCPCGGTYSVHPITREVSCSVHGTTASPKKGAWTPPAVSEIDVRESELSFRLAVDWNQKQ